MIELRQQMPRALDRPAINCGKKHDESCEAQEVRSAVHLAKVKSIV